MGIPLRHRVVASALTMFVGATATLFGSPAPTSAALAYAPNELCSTELWRDPSQWEDCVSRLQDLSEKRIECLAAPTPNAPDSGMAGWFASRADSSRQPGPQGRYSEYGYSGYSYTTYDIGCVPTVMHPDHKFENTVANGEFMIASSIIGASNALREKAWNPNEMWGWANPLVEKATRAVYEKVFTVFGAITLVVVGLYLLWRARQSEMSHAMTTASWAVLIMVVITAIAQWPTWSASVADRTLIGSLDVIHEAVGPPAQNSPPEKCVLSPDACIDHRPPAVRASDTAVDGILYRNWLRGALGSTDSETAKKYGPVLYDAKSLTWGEAAAMQEAQLRKDTQLRKQIVDRKQRNWMKVAERIKDEDPEAYEYLQGTRGMERIGAGFIAVLSALFYAMFDITASLLILLGFLIFRWAVIAAPILGTVGLLRPASSGLRRLTNAVVAAIFNIVIFGTGAAIYLFGVDLIMNTPEMAGWLQVVLIWLTGVVGWLLLRPYRRITQLGGKDSTRAVTSVGGWHRLFLRDIRRAAELKIVEEGDTNKPRGLRRDGAAPEQRPESRREQPIVTASRPAETRATTTGQQKGARPAEWSEPEVPDGAASYTIYRPSSGDVTVPAQPPQRRPESANASG